MAGASAPPRILVVKLSSLGDVVHTLPVVADLLRLDAAARIDWVTEPAFAPIVRRVRGIADVIECPLRRWRKAPFSAATRREASAFARRLRRERYDAVLDLQGLTKSALVARLARGRRFGLANRTEGSSHEAPARWLVDRAVDVTPRSHAVDRGRELVRKALGTDDGAAPDFGLAAGAPAQVPWTAAAARPTLAFIHGTTRADKLWPEGHWIALGRRAVLAGFAVGLPVGNDEEAARAGRIAAGIGAGSTVWPRLPLGDFIDRLGAAAGAIGVDSGPSHIAVALDLPHVQIYNLPTAWRTGPQTRWGASRQVALVGDPVPTVDAVWAAWRGLGVGAEGPARPATPGAPRGPVADRSPTGP